VVALFLVSEKEGTLPISNLPQMNGLPNKKEKPPVTAALSCWGLKPMAGLQKPCRGAPKLQYHKRAGCGIPKEGRAK